MTGENNLWCCWEYDSIESGSSCYRRSCTTYTWHRLYSERCEVVGVWIGSKKVNLVAGVLYMCVRVCPHLVPLGAICP